MISNSEFGERKVYVVNAGSPEGIGGISTVTNKLAKRLGELNKEVACYFPSPIRKPPETKNQISLRPLNNLSGTTDDRFISPEGVRSFISDYDHEKPQMVILNGFLEPQLELGTLLLKHNPNARVTLIFHGDPLPQIDLDESSPWLAAKRMIELGRLFVGRKSPLTNEKVKKVAVSKFISGRVVRLGLAKTDPVVCPPPTYLDEACCKIPPKKGHMGRVNAILVSRVSPQKGLNVLAELATRCQERKIPVDFSIIGAANTTKKDLKYRKLLEGKAIFKGVRTGCDLSTEYRKADVCIISSPSEGSSLVSREALGNGTFVAGRPLPPLIELFKSFDSSPGFLASRMNKSVTAQEITGFLGTIIDNPNLQERLSVSSLEVWQLYNPNKLTNDLIKEMGLN